MVESPEPSVPTMFGMERVFLSLRTGGERLASSTEFPGTDVMGTAVFGCVGVGARGTTVCVGGCVAEILPFLLNIVGGRKECTLMRETRLAFGACDANESLGPVTLCDFARVGAISASSVPVAAGADKSRGLIMSVSI